jgi:NADH-quinone oxidoreductase subunit L
VIILFTNKRKALSHGIAVGAAGLSWLGSMIIFIRALGVEEFGKHVFKSSINWLPTGPTWFKIGVLIDPFSAAVLFFVAWTVLAIFIYSIGYHNFGQPKGDQDVAGLPPHGATVTENGHKHRVPSIEPMYSRFFAFISLFAFGMYTLVISDNLLTLYVGWEIMGLCSYLLIGFWFAKPSARDAAVKAFMTTRIGDVFMLLGIAVFQRDLQTGKLASSGVHTGFLWVFGSRHHRIAVIHWDGRQVSPVAAACLAAGCHGRPDAGKCHDPCGDDGFCRRIYGHPHIPAYLCRLD